MKSAELLPDLFRDEYRKIISVLCKRFGFHQIEVAEDIASETFLTAAHTWGLNGVPENPTAWLYQVAKNKAKNYLNRNNTYQEKVLPELKYNSKESNYLELDLSPKNIEDSQLQMMFAICHPAIPEEAQIGLSLRILCGFGIEEIAEAFLTNKETINKRLFRAKERIRSERIQIEFPELEELDQRLDTVLRTIYLLFNEGYYSSNSLTLMKKNLSYEAIRLCSLLLEHNQTDKPKVSALISLMCFHVSRFDARQDEEGEPITYGEQDRDLWNFDWIRKGEVFLHRASTGLEISKYHLEAGIAYLHTQKDESKFKWKQILKFYDLLLSIESSPIIHLNRVYALSRAHGKEKAIQDAEKLEKMENRYYYFLLGELYSEKNPKKSLLNFQNALNLSRTPKERIMLQSRIDELLGLCS